MCLPWPGWPLISVSTAIAKRAPVRRSTPTVAVVFLAIQLGMVELYKLLMPRILIRLPCNAPDTGHMTHRNDVVWFALCRRATPDGSRVPTPTVQPATHSQ